MMRTWATAGSVILLTLGGALADEPESLHWSHEGYASVFKAAAVAKKEQRRILVGLSGSGT